MRPLRVATFNLLNLALPQHPYYEQLGYSREDYERKISWIASMLDRMRADVVCFQEVFHAKALEDVISRSSYLRGSHVDAPMCDGVLPKVGLASRLPLYSIESITDFPEEALVAFEGQEAPPFKTFSRPVLKVQLALPSGELLHLYGVHLKSRRPYLTEAEEPRSYDPMVRAIGQSRSTLLRAAEATALRAMLLADIKAGRHVIVLGDFNDSDRSVTTEILVGGHPPLGMFSKLVDSDNDRYLYHVLDIQSRRAQRHTLFTHVFGGVHEIVDHILVSRTLLPWANESITQGLFARVLNDHLATGRLHGKNQPRWQSDHGPVVLTLEI